MSAFLKACMIYKIPLAYVCFYSDDLRLLMEDAWIRATKAALVQMSAIWASIFSISRLQFCEDGQICSIWVLHSAWSKCEASGTFGDGRVRKSVRLPLSVL